MKIIEIQNISKKINYSTKEELSSLTSKSFAIYPDEGKAIQNIKTGEVYSTCAYVSKEQNLVNYREI